MSELANRWVRPSTGSLIALSSLWVRKCRGLSGRLGTRFEAGPSTVTLSTIAVGGFRW